MYSRPEVFSNKASRIMAYVISLTFPFNVMASPRLQGFERPLQEQHIPLLGDPANPQAKAELRCFSYPLLMIKELDRGEIGAELSLVSYAPDKAAPLCETQAAQGEIAVQDDLQGLGSLGYFQGKIGEYLIFSAAEDWQGATGLWVYSPKGNKLFADLTYTDQAHIQLLPQAAHTPATAPLSLRYPRVFQAQCSLFADPAGCWKSIQQATGIQGQAPDCRASYKQMLSSQPADLRRKSAHVPSIIEYDIEVIIDRTVVSRLMPVSHAKHCWAPE